jgi:hypothetical protein
MPLKLQWVEPDTCEGVANRQGCRYLELWNTDDPPLTRTHAIAAFERQCTAHVDPDIPIGVMLWADGNWKDLDAYIEYQRAWFRRQNYLQWQIDHAGEPMPPSIAGSTSEPVTSGSVAAPAQLNIDALDNAYALNRDHNARKNVTVGGAVSIKGETMDDISWYWEGAGDSRVLHVVLPSLTPTQRTNLQSIADIQFGVGKVVIEG